MLRNSFILLFIMMLCISVSADTYDNGGHAGYPPGFYDDIDPNSLDEEDEIVPAQRNVQTEVQAPEDAPYVHEFTDDDGVVIAPPKSKSTKNYAQIYNNLSPADFSYLHNIDPDQYYDMKDTAWSVYPLLRLISPIYFKNATIEPGYYLLTPREHDGKWYILFKQNGVVVHIIPAYESDYTPESFYDEHIPQPKLTRSQKIHMGVLKFLGDHVDSSKRREPVKSYLEVNDLENYFVSIIIYYGGHKYSTIFRTIRL